MTDVFRNEENYRDLSKPFDSVADANAAIDAFQTELYALRNKHRIRDLVFVLQVSVTYPEGEGSPTLAGMFGDTNKMEGLAGFAFGRASAERQERINKIVEDSCEAIRAPKKRP